MEEKPPRNPNVPCPTCGCKYLYTDYYDQCYECGRNVGDEELPEVVVCAGPPECPLEGDAAIASAEAGCPMCRHIIMGPGDDEFEYQMPTN